jgi:hypothetical protein
LILKTQYGWRWALLFLASSVGAAQGSASRQMGPPDLASQRTSQTSNWKSPAHLQKGMGRGLPGILSLDSEGILFAPANGPAQHWAANDIKSLDLSPHLLILMGYENRRWHLPTLRKYKFRLDLEMSPAVAAQLAGEVPRPIRNVIPDPSALADTVIPVRRTRHLGGSNGSLRIRQDGIDYVTAQAGQSRSWKWADLQTLSHPDPFHLFVFGYRDTYSFDLKKPLSRELFNRLSDQVWKQNEEGVTPDPAVPSIQPPLHREPGEHE